LIGALDREFGWKSTESNVTALLYTNQKKFLHTKPDREPDFVPFRNLPRRRPLGGRAAVERRRSGGIMEGA
jgi:hypothetical protein